MVRYGVRWPILYGQRFMISGESRGNGILRLSGVVFCRPSGWCPDSLFRFYTGEVMVPHPSAELILKEEVRIRIMDPIVKTILIVLGYILVSAIFFAVGVVYRKKVGEREIGSAETEATRIINEAIRAGESRKKEMLLEAKDEIHKSRTEHDKEVKERRAEISKQERRLEQKEATLDKKTEAFERKEEELSRRLAKVTETQAQADEIKQQQQETLEQISGLTQEQAKQYLLESVEQEVRHDAAMKIKEIEAQLKDEAEEKGREIIATAIQRCAADHAAETTVSVVALPNDEMKGRIIGREGRNIRTLETITGVDLIIDDTPRGHHRFQLRPRPPGDRPSGTGEAHR